ncbi:hypothetical protein Hanom_Chr11g01039711 [Helianthus anomalus]
MSGEGSSPGTSRKQSASTRSPGVAEEPPVERPLREITYRGEGVPHGQSRILWDSPLLHFAYQTTEYLRFQVIRVVKLLDFRRIDWELASRGVAETDVVSFVLGKRIFNMTLLQFAAATGFYTQQEVEDHGFVSLLRGVVKKRQDHCVLKEDLARFWPTIATSPFSKNMVASDIRDPLYRFVHKILAATLIGRHKGSVGQSRECFSMVDGEAEERWGKV